MFRRDFPFHGYDGRANWRPGKRFYHDSLAHQNRSHMPWSGHLVLPEIPEKHVVKQATRGASPPVMKTKAEQGTPVAVDVQPLMKDRIQTPKQEQLPPIVKPAKLAPVEIKEMQREYYCTPRMDFRPPYELKKLALKESGVTKHVVVKKVMPGYQGHSLVQEIKILKQIDHPNIIMLLCDCKIQGKKAFVMPALVCSMDMALLGESSVIPASKFTFPVVMHFCKAMCGAFIYLHNKGIHHNDMRSDNVLLDRDCNPVICDFDIGTSASLAISLEKGMQFNPVVAPELYDNPGGVHLDHDRIDIFGFCGVIHSMVTRDKDTMKLKWVPLKRKGVKRSCVKGVESKQAIHPSLCSGPGTERATMLFDNVVRVGLNLDPSRRQASMKEVESQIEEIERFKSQAVQHKK